MSRENTERPTHVLDGEGLYDRVALCGVRKPLPSIAAFAVPLHREHYPLVLCSACEALLPAVPWLPAWLRLVENVA